MQTISLPSTSASPLKILIVDDCPSNLKLLRAQLEAEGCLVTEACDGLDALKVLNHGSPDAILSDILMPNMDGYRLCLEVRRHSAAKDIPFIFYTSTYTSPEDARLGAAMGADRFLVKPASSSTILKSLQEVLVERKNGGIHPPVLGTAAQELDESWLLKRYSERLIAKIEQKSIQLAERTSIAELSNEIVTAFIVRHDPQETLQCCAGSILRHLDAAFVRIWSFNEPSNTLELQASASLCPHPNAPPDRIRLGEFKTGRLAQHRTPYLTNDVLHDANISDPEWARREGMLAFAGYPLLVDDRLAGVMDLFARHQLSDSTIHSLEAISSQISLGLQRLQAQKALAEREAQYRDFLDSAGDLIQLVTPEGRLVYVNPAWEKTLGYTLADFAEKSFFELIAPEQRAHCESVFAQISRDGGSIHEEGELIASDGRHIFVDGSATGRFEEGKCVMIRCIFRDITEQRRMTRQLERAARLESIGALSGGIAHDLNNILAPIMMSVELLRAKITDPDSLRILGTIASSAQRGANLVRQVLTFARGTTATLGPVDLKHLLREMREVVAQTFPKNITVRVKIGPELWPAIGDPTHLHQILLNLCINARDAMPAGGTLSLSVENFLADRDFLLPHPSARPGPYLCLRVADTGSGIPDEIKSRIFDPFFTTKGPDKGTGLGLATVASILAACGGFITLSSQVGRGTEFHVYLPAESATATAQADFQKSPVCPGNGELILVVDDEAAVRAISRQTLEMFGYQVLTAANGPEGLALLAQHNDQVSLLITDMAMPTMDGLATIKAARALHPGLKVILASGLVSESNLDAEETGVQHFLQKPFTAERLAREVHDVISTSY